jgi:hypothetical protein
MVSAPGIQSTAAKRQTSIVCSAKCKVEVGFWAFREMMRNIAEQLIAIGSFLELHPSDMRHRVR